MTEVARQPVGTLQVRTIAMPSDTNPSGDIFGGWVLSQMDIAGGTAAAQRAKSRVATVGVEAMSFHKPVRVGDVLSCYASLEKQGTTSLTFRIEAWVIRAGTYQGDEVLVTEGHFTFVALDESGRKRKL
ncbi:MULTISPECIES: acyl-CoA thioesterase [Nisaea]|jgi:acyl-CoA thioesterase YciA|uniref:acyl-CoA thioesterase n=1 Tax=Nisaea TaxID=390876 RepID=UPI000403AC62|nr:MULTISPECIES: acyl-CoA thioesterase [Nisaea]